jgi:hypothetical protein
MSALEDSNKNGIVMISRSVEPSASKRTLNLSAISASNQFTSPFKRARPAGNATAENDHDDMLTSNGTFHHHIHPIMFPKRCRLLIQ